MRFQRCFLFLIFLCFSAYAADAQQEEFQQIDYEKEKTAILKFIREFGSTTDPVTIQKYICFPYFIARHMCDPMRGDIGFSSYNNEKICPCKNPVSARDAMEGYNKLLSNPKIPQEEKGFQSYFFRNKKNIDAYCKWFVEAYKLPVKFERKEPYEHYLLDYAEGCQLQLRGYGFSVISLIKLNNQYKVAYVGYVWD